MPSTIAAHRMELGTCPIGLARSWLNQPEVKREIGMPAEVDVVFPLIAGRPAESPAAVSRREPQVQVWS